MKTALIIDDNIDIRVLVQQALELDGYSVLTAENGEAAKAQMPHLKSPCVVLLDLMMPVMDGNGFLAWKNTRPEYSFVPVLVFSAAAKTSNLSGADGFIKKPIDLNEMLETVSRYCK